MRKCVFAVLFGLFFTCIGCFALPVRWKVEGIGIKGRGDSLVVSVNWRFVGDELPHGPEPAVGADAHTARKRYYITARAI